ncbi:hypothetical protein F1559_001118 [Cyanidiococcus yangmingshanensis]|uniref:Uncharacterized protein n=1 Tax=Cyanidiococcus yangmingshanensis TaxID=2690220 RepID=A0A7J7IP11_9RHOD|nr:hypothetical protein F1559_001118 [Cyanidiococcus yangmingshanensis]
MTEDDAAFEKVLRDYGSKTASTQKFLFFIDAVALFLVPWVAICWFVFRVDGRDPRVLVTLLCTAFLVIPLVFLSHLRYARAQLVQLQRKAGSLQLDERRLSEVAAFRALASNNVWYLAVAALFCGHLLNGRIFDALNFAVSSSIGALFLLVNASAAMHVAHAKSK